MSKNPENWWNSMKTANIDREILHNFWTTWGISMKFPGNMWFIIILEVTWQQGLTLSLEDMFFEKPQEGGQIDPSSPSHPFAPASSKEFLDIQSVDSLWNAYVT